MKKWLILGLFFLCAGSAFAQQTQVVGTVVGPNTHPWTNGTAHASLVCPGNAQAYIGTTPIARDTPTVGLDGNGTLHQQLYDTSAMVDVGGTHISCHYVYRITEQCQIANFSTNPLTGITGAGPVDLTSQINATSVNLSPQCDNASGITGVNWFLSNSLVGTEPGYDVIPGTNVTITATNDPGASRVHYTLNATGGGGGGTANYDHNGTLVGTEPTLNIIDSGSVIATVTDNPGNTRVDLTLQAAAGTGSPCDPTGLNVGSSTFCGGPVPTDGPLAVPYIQGNSASVFSFLPPITVNTPFRGPVSTGDTLVIMAACSSFPGGDCHPYAVVTDDLGNTFSLVQHHGVHFLGVDVWTATVAAGGADTVHVVFNSGTAGPTQGVGVIIGEYQNFGSFDALGDGFQPGGTSGQFTATVTTTLNNDILVGIGMEQSVTTPGILSLVSNTWNNTGQFFFLDPTANYGSMIGTNGSAGVAGNYSLTFEANNIQGLNGEADSIIFAFHEAVTPRPSSGPPNFRVLSAIDLPFQVVPLTGTSTSLGGGALSANACASQAVGVNGALIGQDAHATPRTYPGDNFRWEAYVSATSVVTVLVCAGAAGTPTASIYNVRVTP